MYQTLKEDWEDKSGSETICIMYQTLKEEWEDKSGSETICLKLKVKFEAANANNTDGQWWTEEAEEESCKEEDRRRRHLEEKLTVRVICLCVCVCVCVCVIWRKWKYPVLSCVWLFLGITVQKL